MMRGFLTNVRGATAIEFAMVAPIFLLGGLAACVFTILAWQWSILNTVAADTARCTAIASSDCTQPRVGCPAIELAACYAIGRARTLGFRDLLATDIAVREEQLTAGFSVATVDIRRTVSLVGYSIPVVASASFPLP